MFNMANTKMIHYDVSRAYYDREAKRNRIYLLKYYHAFNIFPSIYEFFNVYFVV